jgi:hypothetical protein
VDTEPFSYLSSVTALTRTGLLFIDFNEIVPE